MTDWSALSGRPEVQALAGVLLLGLAANIIFAVGAWRRVRVPAAAWLLAPALCLTLASVGPLVVLGDGGAAFVGVLSPAHLAAKVLVLARGEEILGVLAAVCLLFTTAIVASVGHVAGAGESARWTPMAALPVLGLGLGGSMVVAAVGSALEVGSFGLFTALVVLGASLGLALLAARSVDEEVARERLAGARAMVGLTGVLAACTSGWLLLAVANVLQVQARIIEQGAAATHQLGLAASQLTFAGGLTVLVAVAALGAAAVVAVFPVAIPLSSPRSLTGGFVLALLATLPLGARIPWWELAPHLEEVAVVGGQWRGVVQAPLPYLTEGPAPVPGVYARWSSAAWRGGVWQAGGAPPFQETAELELPVRGGAITLVAGSEVLAKQLSGPHWSDERLVLGIVGTRSLDEHRTPLDLGVLRISWWPSIPSTAPLVAIEGDEHVRVGPPGEERVLSRPLLDVLSVAKTGVVLVPGPTWTVQDVVDFCEAVRGPCALASPQPPSTAGQPDPDPQEVHGAE